MIGKAHQHFLKQKAEKQLIEERKNIEEEKEKEMEKQQAETFRRSDNGSRKCFICTNLERENMFDGEAIVAPLPSRSIIEVPLRFAGSRRWRYDKGIAKKCGSYPW
ncbi:hypothetical protein OUZ56_030013 [Daphnia magna]|uniref:Uncharacterized protein n=1 Tax=Daphnia magna TaxID=35525 RepID=A0ABR0B8I2_9CRUS|nr:hypothetical protein OUZ56_030013 [Daphnia magna]